MSKEEKHTEKTKIRKNQKKKIEKNLVGVFPRGARLFFFLYHVDEFDSKNSLTFCLFVCSIIIIISNNILICYIVVVLFGSGFFSPPFGSDFRTHLGV